MLFVFTWLASLSMIISDYPVLTGKQMLSMCVLWYTFWKIFTNNYFIHIKKYMKLLFIPGVVLSSGTTVVYTAGMVLDLVKFINMCACVKLLQSCLTLWDAMGCSPHGSSVHAILQARILEWVVMPSCRGSSWPRVRTRISYVSCIGRWVLYH